MAVRISEKRKAELLSQLPKLVGAPASFAQSVYPHLKSQADKRLSAPAKPTATWWQTGRKPT